MLLSSTKRKKKKNQTVFSVSSPHIHSKKILPLESWMMSWRLLLQGTEATTEASWAKLDTLPKIHAVDEINIFIKEKHALKYGCELELGDRKGLFVECPQGKN